MADFAQPLLFTSTQFRLIMILVVTFVGFLIHLYSVEYMHDDQDFPRFFAYMNLFVASMLTLVLADNLLLLYLGWEGVGLCSFLLIGFWYREPQNVRAARKAFFVTRCGDTAFALGLFLLFTHLGTLNIQDLLGRAAAQWTPGQGVAVAAAALLLGGAVGKSAQLPLQTWLPDAMAGPTPTSALIHAATMVTAGVYLIARTHTLFSLAPSVQLAVAVIGTATMLLASFSALAQRDMKRVLAYSTISQIGYMFLALGLGAWSAAMFHLMTHAFFKALLFLAAGVVIHAVHEQDLYRMGGLRKELPLAFWSFVIGGSALAGLPLITAGFFSKDLILWQSWAGPNGNIWFWVAGMTGAMLTSLYTFRMILLAFFGPQQLHVRAKSGLAVSSALIVLCVLSIVGGYVDTPPHFGGSPRFSNFLGGVLPPLEEVHVGPITETITALSAIVVFTIGLVLAYLLFGPQRERKPAENVVERLWLAGWGFDWIYNGLFVVPVPVADAEAGERSSRSAGAGNRTSDRSRLSCPAVASNRTGPLVRNRPRDGDGCHSGNCILHALRCKHDSSQPHYRLDRRWRRIMDRCAPECGCGAVDCCCQCCDRPGDVPGYPGRRAGASSSSRWFAEMTLRGSLSLVFVYISRWMD